MSVLVPNFLQQKPADDAGSVTLVGQLDWKAASEEQNKEKLGVSSRLSMMYIYMF